MTRILIFDDDPQLLRALRINLSARRYDVLTAPDGTTGVALASRNRPDLIVVDLGLPDIDGVAVVEGIRGWSTAPIIVLSARHSETVKVNALDAGADDYVTKPFGMDELLARIRAALRRTASAAAGETPVVTTDAFTIDLANRRVTTPEGPVRKWRSCAQPTSRSTWPPSRPGAATARSISRPPSGAWCGCW